MEFMVKTQYGELIQAIGFGIGEEEIEVYTIRNNYVLDYKTNERAKEVFTELEKWVRAIISETIYGRTPGDGMYANEFFIFEFPKE